MKHGVHRGLHIVTMAWWEDCVKEDGKFEHHAVLELRFGDVVVIWGRE